jgi:hypothetical protein
MKGRANHIGPESCVSRREVWSEALTGLSVGQVSSHVTKSVRDADAFCVAEGSTVGCYRQCPAGPAWSETLARRRNLLFGNRETSCLAKAELALIRRRPEGRSR